MVVSESTSSSCWHKCTIGADRGGEIFDMLSRRGVQPVVPVPESAVDQFSGLSGARPQSGFAGKVSVLRMPLSSCPGLWPPSAASSGRRTNEDTESISSSPLSAALRKVGLTVPDFDAWAMSVDKPQFHQLHEAGRAAAANWVSGNGHKVIGDFIHRQHEDSDPMAV